MVINQKLQIVLGMVVRIILTIHIVDLWLEVLGVWKQETLFHMMVITICIIGVMEHMQNSMVVI